MWAIEPDKCIDFVMAFPPYRGLRDYGVGDHIGPEKSPQEYIDKLAAIFRDLRCVLRPHGSLYGRFLLTGGVNRRPLYSGGDFRLLP